MSKSQIACALFGVAVAATAASAQLAPAFGPGTGNFRIEHGTSANVGNTPGLPVFGPGGTLVTAGGNFPTLGGVIAGNVAAGGLVANVPVSLNTPAAGAVAGINAANTTLVGVGGGGRAGIIAPVRFLDVGAVPGGGIAANAYGGQADYVNAGLFPLTMPIVSFSSGTINLGAAAAGDFGAVGVRSVIQVGIGVGINFIPTSTAFLNDIIVRFDGAGGRNDDVLGDIGVFNQPNATTLNFSVASVGAVVGLVPGATLRLLTVATIMGDPMSFTGTDLDPSIASQLPSEFVGFGSSNNAASIIPTPGAMGLLGVAGLFATRRRRARA